MVPTERKGDARGLLEANLVHFSHSRRETSDPGAEGGAEQSGKYGRSSGEVKESKVVKSKSSKEYR